jgi:hypothetical protein
VPPISGGKRPRRKVRLKGAQFILLVRIAQLPITSLHRYSLPSALNQVTKETIEVKECSIESSFNERERDQPTVQIRSFDYTQELHLESSRPFLKVTRGQRKLT